MDGWLDEMMVRQIKHNSWIPVILTIAFTIAMAILAFAIEAIYPLVSVFAR